MAKNLSITGKNALDEMARFKALEALQKNAKTDELVKLQKAINKPDLRAMLQYI